MEDIGLSEKDFIDRFVYLMEIAIFAHKQENVEDQVLTECWKLLESHKKNKLNYSLVIKRINVYLKVDSQSNAIDAKNRDNLKIANLMKFSPHPAIVSGDMSTIDPTLPILHAIPIGYFTQSPTHSKLMGLLLQCLFYLSQVLIILSQENDFMSELFDSSIQGLSVVLESIMQYESDAETNKLSDLNDYLKSKTTEITADRVDDASAEIKNIFRKKGVSDESAGTVERLVDSITSKLKTSDFSSGNMIQNIMDIAKNVAEEIKGSAKNPEDLRDVINASQGIFSEMVSQQGGEGGLPFDITQLMSSVMTGGAGGLGGLGGSGGSGGMPDISQLLGKITGGGMGGASKVAEDTGVMPTSMEGILQELIRKNNLDPNDFNKSVRNSRGDIDNSKLEKALVQLSSKKQ
jgi:hypothetical protein